MRKKNLKQKLEIYLEELALIIDFCTENTKYIYLLWIDRLLYKMIMDFINHTQGIKYSNKNIDYIIKYNSVYHICYNLIIESSFNLYKALLKDFKIDV